MNIAVIDIGTNTARLAIFDASDSESPVLIHKNSAITRLGGGLNETGRLSTESIQKTIHTIQNFLSDISERNVMRTVAVGTQAIRVASNGGDFIMMLKEEGLELELITGDTEGTLVFRGVSAGLKPAPKGLVTIDIGGGSTEISWGDSDVMGVVSFPVGSVVMTEKFLKHNPPLENEIEDFKKYCLKLFEPVAQRIDEVLGEYTCAGVAGTVTTVAMIGLDLKKYDSEKVHGSIMDSLKISDVAEKLLNMTSEERLRIPGMQPGRADIIHAGALIFSCVAKALKVSEVFISEMDIRHGLLQREIQRMSK